LALQEEAQRPGGIDMRKAERKGRKRWAKENYKRKVSERNKKTTTRWKPTFWTQEPARMTDD
jgi:hypothetical protein